VTNLGGNLREGGEFGPEMLTTATKKGHPTRFWGSLREHYGKLNERYGKLKEVLRNVKERHYYRCHYN